MRENQNGFLEGKTTVAQILTLSTILEEVKKNNQTAVLCFIDIKQAFDSIHRGTTMKIVPIYSRQ